MNHSLKPTQKILNHQMQVPAVHTSRHLTAIPGFSVFCPALCTVETDALFTTNAVINQFLLFNWEMWTSLKPGNKIIVSKDVQWKTSSDILVVQYISLYFIDCCWCKWKKVVPFFQCRTSCNFSAHLHKNITIKHNIQIQISCGSIGFKKKKKSHTRHTHLSPPAISYEGPLSIWL